MVNCRRSLVELCGICWRGGVSVWNTYCASLFRFVCGVIFARAVLFRSTLNLSLNSTIVPPHLLSFTPAYLHFYYTLILAGGPLPQLRPQGVAALHDGGRAAATGSIRPRHHRCVGGV